jgi:hypothetical protein
VGAWAIMLAVMFVATAISGAALYYSMGHSSSAIGVDSPHDGGAASAPSDSTAGNFTALAGQVALADIAMPAHDFTANGTTSTFTCASSPSGAYLELTDKNTGGDSVASVSIATVGAATVFTPSGTCDISAATTYIIFPATSQISPSAVSGQTYEGFVSLADGVPITFNGTWQ